MCYNFAAESEITMNTAMLFDQITNALDKELCKYVNRADVTDEQIEVLQQLRHAVKENVRSAQELAS